MVAILAASDRIETMLMDYDCLSIAAYNGPRNTVVSGNSEALELLLSTLAEQGIEYRRLTVSHAFHSALMQPIMSDFRQVAEDISYQKPQLPLVSNVSGCFAGDEIAHADYWIQHVLAPVRFTDGLQQLLAHEHHFMLEIGPAATLVGMAKQSVPEDIILAASLTKELPPRTTMLSVLGEYWLSGGEVDWSLIGMQPRRDIPLPMYPFQRRDYSQHIEIDAAHGDLRGATSIEHPLLQRSFKSPLLQETLFETIFSRKNQPFIEEHRVFGKLVVSGASHLSLVLSALTLAGLSNNGACSVTEVMFPMALIVPEEGECAVQLSITPQTDIESEFRLISLSDDVEPKLHAKGRICNDVSPAKAPDLHAIWQRCTEVVPADEVYEVQRKRHIVVGPSYHWLTELHRGQSEVIARLALPTILVDVIDCYSLHPGLIDSCFGAMVMAQPMEIVESFIPFSLESLHFYPPKDGFSGVTSFIAHVVVHQHDKMRMVGDIYLCSEQGELIAAFVGLEGRRASRHALFDTDESKPALYHINWEKKPLTTMMASTSTPTHYLVFSDGGEIALQFIHSLKNQGIRVTIVSQNPKTKRLTKKSEDHYVLSATTDSHFKQLLAACGTVNHMVYLWGLSQCNELFDDQQTACAGALHLLQALGEDHRTTNNEGKVRLILVTQGAQTVLENEQLPAPQHALLWGLGTVASAEHSEWTSICLDLEVSGSIEQSVANLIATTMLTDEENRIAWRNNCAYCARLETSETPSKSVSTFVAKADVTYLVTGAQGAIARELAPWLIARGARHLALVGRSDADQEFLDSLRKLGAEPHFYQADVADISAMATVIEQIETHQTPLAGVFHLAGMLEDGLLASQNWLHWKQVLAPKVTGAWNLHQLTKTKNLSVFVNFSSLASILGPAGQSNYAAANAFLDALAKHRCGVGLAGLSVNWGPWAEVGMAAQLNADQQARMESLGVGRISTRNALDNLAKLMSANQAQSAVLTMDWQRYCQTNNAPFFNSLMVARTDTSIFEQLQQATSDDRQSRLTEVLVTVVIEVLALPDNEVAPRARLFDLGIDSLTALDIKNRLQKLLDCSLSSTLLFDHPTIEALTDYFLDKLFPVSVPQVPEPVVEYSPLQQDNDVEDMSEAEAEALLLAQLERMEKQS
jgi:acyl transferase domain-containing protein/acyl carrier protein